MKYIMGLIIFILGMGLLLNFVSIDVDDMSHCFGTVFILLGNLFFNYKRED